MKIRLFFFITAILIGIGLLMPVGVYANDTSRPDVTIEVTVEGVDVAGEICVQRNEETPSATVSVNVDGNGGEDESDSDSSTECDDNDGTQLRVSWNS